MKTAFISGIFLTLAASVSLLSDFRELPWWSLRLGWTLVHSSWQLTLIAIMTFLVNVGLSRCSAKTRYFASVCALVCMFVVPCWTWSLTPEPAPRPLRPVVVDLPVTEVKTSPPSKIVDPIKVYSSEVGLVPNPDLDSIANVQPIVAADIEPPATGKSIAGIPVQVLVPSEQGIRPEPESSPEVSLFDRWRMTIVPWLGFIDTCWLVGVLFLSFRPAWGLWMQYRLRQTGLSNVPDAIRLQMQQLAQRIGVSSVVRIAVSALVKVPMVVGYLRPIILLPASVLTGLTPTELESLLAHELAHIRRHDWIVNALQVVVETLLFYHPAVWWVSHCIRHERELCCDDLALTIIQDKAKYGRMLLVLEELLHHSPPPALAATGGDLVYRIRRLLPVARPPKRSFNGWPTAFVMLILMGLAGGLSILSAQPSRSEPPKKLAVEPKDKAAALAKESQTKDAGTDDAGSTRKPATTPSVADASESQMTAVLTLSSHAGELREPLIDIGRMTIHESQWYAPAHATRLYHDRWLRSRGYGDLLRTQNGDWISFRGALMLVLDMESLEEAAQLPLVDLKSRLSAEGRIRISEEEFKTRILAIQTAEGHVAVAQTLQPFPWSLKLDLRRLTIVQEAHLEHPNDGAESAAWGPVVDGLQAGIVYRRYEPTPKMQVMIGDMVSVKLFVRNAGRDEKTYSWQLVDENSHLDAVEKSERPKPTLPIIDSWQPTLVDAKGNRAIISPENKYREFVLQTATLKPGEAVLVGAAATTLWSAIDVDFGTAADRLSAVEATPGEYRLSSDLDTGLVGSPKLHTGELLLQVVQTDPERAQTYALLDSISCRLKNHSYGDESWTDVSDQPAQQSETQPDLTQPPSVKPRRSRRDPFHREETPKLRPLLGRLPGEYLTLPGLVYDEATKKPVVGADVTIEIEANSDGASDDLCRYHFLTNAEGQFTVRVPRRLLSGYADKFVGTVQALVTHPNYNRAFIGDDEKNLRSLGLIDKNGKILKQGRQPEPGKPKNNSNIQLAELLPARTISGRLLGPDNQPLPNTQITAYERTWIGFPSVLLLEHTDAEGRFRFNVPAKVTAQIEFQTRGLPNKELTVEPTQTELGDLSAAEGRRIRGQVLDAEGKPVGFVTMTAPPVTRKTGEMVSVFKTDEKGQFESNLLQPGEYQLQVGEIQRPDDDRERNAIRTSGPPPDLYIPYRFKVDKGGTLPEVTLSPAKSTIITATLVSTITSNGERNTDAFDVMLVKNLIENSGKTLVNGVVLEDEKSPQLTVAADVNTGKISVKGDPDNKWAFSLGMLCMLVDTPYVVAQGTLAGDPWTASTNAPFLFGDGDASTDEEPPETKKNPPQVTLKVPHDVQNLTLAPAYPIQHFQIGSGPKLFGNSVRVPKLETDQLELKVYHYKATTLRVRLVDAKGQPVVMTENKLPEGLTINARYSREDEVRQAGAIIDIPNPQTTSMTWNKTPVIWDNEVFHFVLPDEEIEITVTVDGMKSDHRFTLKEGETRTAQLKFGPKAEWTESSKPTPKVEFEE